MTPEGGDQYPVDRSRSIFELIDERKYLSTSQQFLHYLKTSPYKSIMLCLLMTNAFALLSYSQLGVLKHGELIWTVEGQFHGLIQ